LIRDFPGADEDADAVGAETVTAGGLEENFTSDAFGLHLGLEGGGQFFAAQGKTTGAAADQDLELLWIPFGPNLAAVFGKMIY
jgi:hypothetical protein